MANKALLGKWSWRYMNENGNLWRKMVIVKCGDAEFGWFPSIPMALMGTIVGDESLKLGDIFSAPFF